jgi:hypothetical protein
MFTNGILLFVKFDSPAAKLGLPIGEADSFGSENYFVSQHS